MKICVVGASGLVGSHCVKVFENEHWSVIGTHLNFATEKTVYFDPLKDSTGNFDITAFMPDVIIHCGALTNVDYCEDNEAESEKVTVNSAKKLAEYCIANNVKLVYISTDYIFNGKNGPYTEDEEPDPINVYGKHKLMAEQITKTTNNYLIARITNVYGEEIRSKNFISRLILMLQNTEEKELKLPFDQFSTPVYAGDVARMLYKLIADNKTGVYHLSSTDYYTRYHLAERVHSYFIDNNAVKIKSVPTNYLGQPAQRPLNGGLLNIKFVSEYNDFKLSNVDDFVKKMKNDEL
ncbi:SDR family oxidoreductase [Mucilaginibacter pocheonensis]|uniref:dTDP-4-dehydrorhamnose reductase n=1 Tax=Mucilaginibacter pocheonensis TaxID=398050 RepID=A0ABU1T702_9SPHI|nr:SDR family oxidoreductase [Mucilaginibacter pocheonensis]MDR6941172.1 dTDP-4-dehydrorhamnose reductase [Mucilaginibacter pocheonensis]